MACASLCVCVCVPCGAVSEAASETASEGERRQPGRASVVSRAWASGVSVSAPTTDAGLCSVERVSLLARAGRVLSVYHSVCVCVCVCAALGRPAVPSLGVRARRRARGVLAALARSRSGSRCSRRARRGAVRARGGADLSAPCVLRALYLRYSHGRVHDSSAARDTTW